MTMTPEKKMIKARLRLLLYAPFFGTIAMRLKVGPVDWVPTAATDGVHLYYNPKFIEPLSLSETVGLIAHEVMHVVLLHHLRIQERHPLKWNVAGDLVINPMVIEAGFDLPPDGLMEEKYKGMATEKVYSLLPNPPTYCIKCSGSCSGGGGGEDGEEGSGGGSGMYGDKHQIGGILPQKNPDGSSMSDAQKAEAEGDLKVAIKQAANAAKKAGKLPAGLARLIDEITEPKADWKALLARFINAFAKNDYSYRKPNRRFMRQGLIIPGLRSNELGQLVLCLDTSGSITSKELNQFAGELTSILEIFDVELRILYADTKVYDGGSYTKYDFPLDLKPRGGGGTSFSPVTKFIEKEGIIPTALIYFTDCYVGDWGKEPSYPVMIASTEEKAPEPPFGEVIEIY